MSKLSTREKLKIVESKPELWLYNFVKIRNADNEEVPFKLNQAQLDFIKNKSRFNIIGKTRQLGFSTLMLGMMIWSAHIKDGSEYLMITDKSDNTQNLFQRLKNMYESIPDDIRIPNKRSNRAELLLENGSRISVQTAGYREIGRGFSCEIIHLSEFAFWGEDVQEKALISLEQALLKNDNASLVIESTSNGIGNKYYEIFMNSRRGNSKYKNFFYGWATKTHREMFRWEIEEAAKQEIAKNHGNPYLIKNGRLDFSKEELHLYENYDITVNQLLWRRWKMQDLGVNGFNQEFPISPEVSFIQSDRGFFDAKKIVDRINFAPSVLPYSELGKQLPLKLDKYFENGLMIYKAHEPKQTYFMGVDVSAGLQQDHSTIQVIDSDGEQVASFSRNDLPVYVFEDVVFELGMYYNYGVITIERNSYGLDLINRLRGKGYRNILRYASYSQTGRKEYKLGFHTNQTSKTKMMNDLKEVFELGLILINDRETLEQMKIYVSKNGKLGNIRGKNNHDDLVDALGLAVQSLKRGISYV